MFFVSGMRFVTGCSLTLQQRFKALIPWELTDSAVCAVQLGRDECPLDGPDFDYIE
jgi:hypothetical protein